MTAFMLVPSTQAAIPELTLCMLTEMVHHILHGNYVFDGVDKQSCHLMGNRQAYPRKFLKRPTQYVGFVHSIQYRNL